MGWVGRRARHGRFVDASHWQGGFCPPTSTPRDGSAMGPRSMGTLRAAAEDDGPARGLGQARETLSYCVHRDRGLPRTATHRSPGLPDDQLHARRRRESRRPTSPKA
jgi:hypothetical protein